ncbi:hypothetical protein PV04_10853 [Phialophora macrospora]|uniref:FAD-binding PCMH-type domain-containing protein n=1 Tax=Phialophora macrospora TaxID=1851006 RepID=A0A0D2FRQ9_9EURO|nr:hypothetical protein PV04_10853 [Phialophora macrospora]
MQKIPEFTGPQFPFSTDPRLARSYADVHRTLKLDQNMPPAVIALPRHAQDVRTAIKYARQKGYQVSVFTGGHYYDGGLYAQNKSDVQLNLTLTYPGPKHIGLMTVERWVPYSAKNQIWVDVSQTIGELNRVLREGRRFLPHGQCSDVQLVGRGHRCGGGQLGRSFGLLGDRIRAIRMISHTGESELITTCHPKAQAILGGDPGAFGVVTHYSLQAFADEDFDFPDTGTRPRGFKGVWRYNQRVLKLLLNEVAAMADDPSLPPNFDLSVNLFSASFPMLRLIPNLNDSRSKTPEGIAGEQPGHADTTSPVCVVVFAQWVPMSRQDRYTDQVDAWFQKFRNLNTVKNGCIHTEELVQPMSAMTGEWLFRGSHEFELPYIRRMYLTKSKTIVRSGWVDTLASQVDAVLNLSRDSSLSRSCYLAAKIQCLGGNLMQPNDDQLMKRDWTVCQTLDCFHPADSRGESIANEWQSWNDFIFCTLGHPSRGPDKRVLWTLSSDQQMDPMWSYYRHIVRDKYSGHGMRQQQTKHKYKKRARHQSKQRAKQQTRLHALCPKQIVNPEQQEQVTYRGQVADQAQVTYPQQTLYQDATMSPDQPTLQDQPTFQEQPMLPEEAIYPEGVVYPEQLMFEEPAMNPVQATILEHTISPELAVSQELAMYQQGAAFQNHTMFQEFSMNHELAMYQLPATFQDSTISELLTLEQELAMNQELAINQHPATDGQPSMNHHPANQQRQMEVYNDNSWGVVPNPYSCSSTALYCPPNQPWCEVATTES